MNKPNAALVVAEQLERCPRELRGGFLRELLAHTAAGLVIIEGDKKAAEACYRLSDAVVSRSG